MLVIQRPTVEAFGEEANNRQRFAVGPLEPGFGHTIGNSLRRVLLSSIPGAAITAVRFDDALHEFCVVELCICHQVFRNVFFYDDLAHFAFEVVRLHFDQIDDAFEFALEPDRDLHQDRVVPQLFAELLADAVRVGALPVGLVDEGEARDAVAAHLTVDRHRLRLHTRDGAQHEDGAVEHAQGTLDLDREIDVTRRVDDVDVVAGPLAVRRGGLDRDAALAFEVHRVHLGAHAVFTLDVVNDPDALGIKEDALRERRLPRVDVRADTDVADE